MFGGPGQGGFHHGGPGQGGGFHHGGPGQGGGFHPGGGFNTGAQNSAGFVSFETKDLLATNQSISSGQAFKAKTHSYHARLEQDGELVVYMNDHFHQKNAMWRSKSGGKGHGPYRLVMQDDGNLVIYDSHNKATWASGTDKKGASGHKVVMQDDGNLVLYDGNSKPTWNTGTHRT